MGNRQGKKQKSGDKKTHEGAKADGSTHGTSSERSESIPGRGGGGGTAHRSQSEVVTGGTARSDMEAARGRTRTAPAQPHGLQSGGGRQRAGSMRYGTRARVEAIPQVQMEQSGLVAFPPHIFGQVFLRQLFFARNQITTIPEQLSELGNVTLLDLSYNQVTVIPEAVVSLVHLEKLMVPGNAVGGDAEAWPADMSGMKALSFVDCSMNDLGGSVPVALTTVPELVELRMLHTGIRELPALGEGQWRALSSLNVAHNGLTELPECVGLLESLQDLRAEHNGLRGLPESLGGLKHLESLNVSHNALTSLPSGLWACPLLQRVDASHNLIASWAEGRMDAEGALGHALCDVFLGWNRLQQIPVTLGRHTGLLTLDLDGNRIVDLSQHALGTLNQLSALSLADNGLSHIPAWLGTSLTGLEELNLFGNPLGDEGGLEGLAGLGLLVSLSVGETGLTCLPDSWCSLTHLEELDVSGNALVGLPEWLAACPLKRVQASRNALASVSDALVAAWREHEAAVDVSYNALEGGKALQTWVGAGEGGAGGGLLQCVGNPGLADTDPHLTVCEASDDAAWHHHALQGRRPTMEDAAAVVTALVARGSPVADAWFGGRQVDYAAVYDGHAGDNAARFMAKHWHTTLVDVLAAADPADAQLPGLFDRCTKQVETQLAAAYGVDMAAVEGTGMQTMPLKEATGADVPSGSSDSEAAPPQRAGGTTASIVLIARDADTSPAVVWAVNIGDSRVVHCTCNKKLRDPAQRSGSCDSTSSSVSSVSSTDDACAGRRLSTEHKPLMADELARIRNLGGFVTPDGRVNGVVSVSRAVGDFGFKPWLEAAPDSNRYDDLDADDLVVIACDGIWDVMDERTASRIVWGALADTPLDALEGHAKRLALGRAASRLCSYAYNYGSTDNLSVMVLI